MRQEFEMTTEQLATLMEACKPVPCIVIGGWESPSQQENANRAWEALGKELGFDYLTARPVTGKGTAVFTAELTEKKDAV